MKKTDRFWKWSFGIFFLILIIILILRICHSSQQSDDCREHPIKEIYQDIHFIENDPSKDYVDHNRPLKALCTEFITQYCVNDPYEFLSLVITRHEQMLKHFAETRQLPVPIFCYKGGNLLLVIYRAFTQQFPLLAREALIRHFSPYFLPSDADFSVYYPPDQYSSLDVEALTNLCVNIQKQLRREFVRQPMTYFTFFQYNRSRQEMLVESLREKVNQLDLWKTKNPRHPQLFQKQMNALQFGSVCSPEKKCTLLLRKEKGRTDATIRFVNERTKKQIQVIREGTPQMIYVQDNRALYFFKKGTSLPTHFDLIRSKFSFSFLVSSSSKNQNKKDEDHIFHTNGELIDVSLSRNKEYLKDFWKNRRKIFTRYSIPFSTSSHTIQVFGYTYSYFVEDLHRILFVDNTYPWQDEKYKKRLHRFVFLCFLDLFLQITDWFVYLQKVAQCLTDFIYRRFEESSDYKFWKNHLSTQDLAFQRLLQHAYDYRDVYTIKMDVDSRESNIQEYQDFLHLCLQDTLVCLNVYSDLKLYFMKNGKIQEQLMYRPVVH